MTREEFERAVVEALRQDERASVLGGRILQAIGIVGALWLAAVGAVVIWGLS